MKCPDMPGFSFKLPAPVPFSFRLCLDYLSGSNSECLYAVHEDRIRRLVSLAGRDVLLEVSSKDDLELVVTALYGGPLNEAEQLEAAAYVTTWFDLNRDLDPFYRLASSDARLAGVVRNLNGLRLMGIPDLFEALCWAILGQQVNLAFAYTLKERLTSAYGDSVQWEGNVYRRFPTPEQMLAVSADELGALKLSRMKSATILEVAGLMAAGKLSREGLLAMDSFDAMEERLVSIRGIGPWTAHYVRMRCLGDPTAFPIGDVGLHNAVKNLLSMEKKPSLDMLREMFNSWQGWEAYATFYLWRTLY
ncbi:DNA-3-methyladenine glycosylase family protein [Paenibacillus apis]|uniref:DNA-3-methyladenine glycosylase II n=1 Tax=Paenibacillus apis TaxID=1792174 RepID=A0A919Y4N1_9BACL|nr:DNA-3-methyladenine glycosylase [Paenibacillus apis]GIO44582.1 DNA-3-methyladenine glycosylase [Paenibacillus apis]